jgi:hypothetical protein
MRWDNLFDDLESQLEQELSAEEVDLRAEEERLRLARLGIRDRLLAIDKGMLKLVLADGSRIAVAPSTFGRDWCAGELIEESGRRPHCVVPLDAIAAILLGKDQVTDSLGVADKAEAPDSLSARLGLPFVLRDLCRRRQPLELLVDDRGTTSGRMHGTIDRVGRDHLDLAVHEAGRPRRESEVTEYRIVRLSQLLLVRF